MALPPAITISEEAATHLQDSFAKASEEYIGLLVTLSNNKGCAGAEYKFQPIQEDAVQDDYEMIEDKGIKLYISRKDILFVFGAELTLHKDDFVTRLDFKNPNETSRCGCGESIEIIPIEPPKP